MQLKMDGVWFSYGKNDVLRDVYLELDPSEVLGILGPNGSGKTTMIRCINGILTPRQGSIALDSMEIVDMPRSDIAKSLGYVPQNSVNDLCTPTVFEVVLMGRRPHITWEFGETDKKIVWEAMEEMDVKHLASSRFDRLSSGQTQRVLMARAIAQEAKILLLDEPTSNLDVKYQIDVMRAIRDLVNDRKVSACAIIHDLDLAMRFCDKVVLLHEGGIIAAGETEKILNPDNIKLVYDVESIIDRTYNRPRVLIL
jgi:ABC-type cobalamin/Fe3+-siderophores transport systems, ATPase components